MKKLGSKVAWSFFWRRLRYISVVFVHDPRICSRSVAGTLSARMRKEYRKAFFSAAT